MGLLGLRDVLQLPCEGDHLDPSGMVQLMYIVALIPGALSAPESVPSWRTCSPR